MAKLTAAEQPSGVCEHCGAQPFCALCTSMSPEGCCCALCPHRKAEQEQVKAEHAAQLTEHAATLARHTREHAADKKRALFEQLQQADAAIVEQERMVAHLQAELAQTVAKTSHDIDVRNQQIAHLAGVLHRVADPEAFSEFRDQHGPEADHDARMRYARGQLESLGLV